MNMNSLKALAFPNDLYSKLLESGQGSYGIVGRMEPYLDWKSIAAVYPNLGCKNDIPGRQLKVGKILSSRNQWTEDGG